MDIKITYLVVHQNSGKSIGYTERGTVYGVGVLGYGVWGMGGASHRSGYGYGRLAVVPEAPGMGYDQMLASRTARGMGYTTSLYPLQGANASCKDR